MPDRNRTDDGTFDKQVSDDDVLDAIERAEDPVVTASELADDLPISRAAVRYRLRDLENRGLVASKRVGARAVVWWDRRPPRGRDDDRPRRRRRGNSRGQSGRG